MNTQHTNISPAEAAALVERADASTRSAKQSDAWPIVVLEMVLGAVLSLALLAQVVAGTTTGGTLMVGAGLAWLVPAFILYFRYAKGWQRGTTFRFVGFVVFATLCLVLGVSTVGVLGFGWVPFAAAAAIWVATPIAALLELRD
ncbi:hypothetical protein MTQ12_10775 [Brevibacterium sp. R8603A2]|uniref:DUF2568 domain-containing protein n=1 Tax=Brevibacterium pityocampae TaxID=506594 RepID=A0ABP8JC29_9MICO|nr:hypothetical protein [Brevibacterium sp. R8603A2]MCK1803526.1 hypothetical protein [Brevibacterium sp. R8603A2]